MSIPTLRDASPADAPAVAELARRTFTDTFAHLYAPADLAAFLQGHSKADWRAILSDPDQAVRVAEADGVPVAYARIAPPTLPFDPRGPSLELKQFYLLASHHGTGLADRLMAWATAAARARGAADLYLSVFTGNPRARRFYERHGFEVVGSYQFTVGDHRDDEHIMRLAL